MGTSMPKNDRYWFASDDEARREISRNVKKTSTKPGNKTKADVQRSSYVSDVHVYTYNLDCGHRISSQAPARPPADKKASKIKPIDPNSKSFNGTPMTPEEAAELREEARYPLVVNPEHGMTSAEAAKFLGQSAASGDFYYFRCPQCRYAADLTVTPDRYYSEAEWDVIAQTEEELDNGVEVKPMNSTGSDVQPDGRIVQQLDRAIVRDRIANRLRRVGEDQTAEEIASEFNVTDRTVWTVGLEIGVYSPNDEESWTDINERISRDYTDLAAKLEKARRRVARLEAELERVRESGSFTALVYLRQNLSAAEAQVASLS